MTVNLQDRSEELLQPRLGSAKAFFGPAPQRTPPQPRAAARGLRMDVKATASRFELSHRG